MALHFGKRENDQGRPLGGGMATPRYGQASPSAQASQASAPAAVATPLPSESDSRTSVPSTSSEGGSKLTVGPNIKLKGVEITDCDTLVVEGMVEATMDSRVIHIAEQGAFKGSAEVDVAEIHGSIEGNLTVRQRLLIHATGRVTGRIRYGKLVIEEGGQLSGDVECAAAGAATRASHHNLAKATPPKSAMVLAA